MRPPQPRHILYWLIPCLVYGWAVLHSPTKLGRELFPTPDAIEYAMLANRLAHLEAPLIQVGVWEFPSRYPLSYPILLAPFAWVFNVNRLWIASALMGLAATGLIARLGRWLMGSRAAGGLAALFWALHPTTLSSATLAMSEMGLMLVWLLLLELARPWIEQRGARQTLARAALAGLAVGWLSVAKAPFTYWAGALGLMMLLWGRRRDVLVFGGAIAACFAANILYQRWAFGVWGMNGYRFWDPMDYTDLGVTFNLSYLTEGWKGLIPGSRPPSNLEYYGRAVFGLTHDFYAPYMGVTVIAAALCAVWPRRRGRPTRPAVLLMAGWALTGATFCLLYFFQAVRFAFIWIVLADLLAAWGLIHVPLWAPLRRGPARRFGLKIWAQLIALLVAVLLLRGEWRRDRAMYFQSDLHGRSCLADTIPALLERVPAGEWLISGYELPLIPFYRSTPGPNVALYASAQDFGLLNGHVYTTSALNLKSRRTNKQQAQYIDPIPYDWWPGTSLLINPAGHWQINAGERRRLFEGKPVWLLMARPTAFEPSTVYQRDVIWPILLKEARVELVKSLGEASLYKVHWAVPRELPDKQYE